MLLIRQLKRNDAPLITVFNSLNIFNFPSFYLIFIIKVHDLSRSFIKDIFFTLLAFPFNNMATDDIVNNTIEDINNIKGNWRH